MASDVRRISCMTRTFNCASCSAPLDFTGAVTQKCEHCGSTVIAPHDMFYAANPAPFDDLRSLTGRALKIAEVQRLIHGGKKIEAIKIFREAFGTGLKEAKDAVEAIERGESLNISGFRIQSSRVPDLKIDIDAQEIGKAAKGVGKIVAIVGGLFALGALAFAGIVVFFVFYSSRTPSITPVPTSPAPSTPEAKVAETSPFSELMKIGGEGNGDGKFKDNRHVAVDGKGRIYSSDYSPMQVQVFDAEGKFLNRWKTEQGTNLYDLAADREGNVYVANDRGLFKFEGEIGKQIAKDDRVQPRGLALSSEGKLIVTEGKSFSIFGKDLKLLKTIETAAEQESSTFGFDKVAVDGKGTIYMLGRNEKDVFKFSPDGKFLNRFPHSANSANTIAVDPVGRIFIAETSSIKVFDANGQKVADLKSYQAFGLAFNSEGEMFLASRPYVVKYRLDL